MSTPTSDRPLGFWSATAAVVATNARKLLSVALSFALFPKPFSIGFALSGLAAIGGVYLHSRGKSLKRAAEAASTTSTVTKHE